MILSIFYYMFCSSVMLVTNKVAVFHMPVPGLVACTQLAMAVGTIQVAKALGCMDVDELDMAKSWAIFPYVTSFIISVYTNMKALEASNVETVIVFRACSPLIVNVLEVLYLNKELPTMRSVCVLLGVLASATGYVLSDGLFHMAGFAAYGWAGAYLLCVSFSMTEGKRLMSNVQFQSHIWGRVLYTNALSLPGLLALAVVAREPFHFRQVEATPQAFFWLALSCVVGLGISWAGWNCRDKTSATQYTLIGLVCKLLTVLLNMLFWDKHASLQGMVWLLVCLGISTLYESPFLKTVPVAPSLSSGAPVAAVIGKQGLQLLWPGMLQRAGYSKVPVEEEEDTGEETGVDLQSMATDDEKS